MSKILSKIVITNVYNPLSARIRECTTIAKFFYNQLTISYKRHSFFSK